MTDKVLTNVHVRNVDDQLWREFKARSMVDGYTIREFLEIALRAYLSGKGQSKR